MEMKVLKIEQTESTNSWLAEHSGELEAPCMVYAREQTAGRGQRGNSWEAQPGKNLTASILFVPEGVEPCRQFVVSEAVALAVIDLLADLGVEAMVKWPNDIYVGNRKICGILIENAITGRTITRTIAGIGVNINQQRFLSDAPNPVSVWQLTGKEHSVDDVARRLSLKVGNRLDEIAVAGKTHSCFMEKLWRGDGKEYPFRDRLRNETISASIADVAEDGVLSLRDSCGEIRRFTFKEVEFVVERGEREEVRGKR